VDYEGGRRVTDLFLSYKAEDRPRVAPLVQALETDGLSIWWDAHIGGGEDWRDTILRHLEAAKAVIVVWSERSVGPHGHFVRDEATRALKRGTYFPIHIDNVDPPLGFGETQALDLSGWRGERSDPRYQAVLSALRRRLGIKAERAKLPQPHPNGINRRAVVIGGSAAAVAAAGAGAWFLTRPSRAQADSIAVLPFANLSGDPKQSYFSDGIAEELRNALARLAGLKVVGRTSSEAVRNDDAATAAKKLGVANVLTGSVRRSPSTIRVSAQLVDGRTGIERWSENYDRAPGDAIKIQTDIAENVARALAVALAGAARAAIALGGTQNAAAQNILLKAIAKQRGESKEDLKESLSLTDAAIALDPNYAEAYVYKALGLISYAGNFANEAELPEYRAQAMRVAQQALSLAPDLASAHNALAQIHHISLNLRAADQEYKRALRLSPGEAETVRDYAQFAAKMGRVAESRRLSAQALELDRLNPDSYYARFMVLIANRSFEEAIDFTKLVERTRPEMFRWQLEASWCELVLGHPDEAKRYFEQRPSLMGRAFLAIRTKSRPEAELAIAGLRREFGDAASYQYAQIYSGLGDKDRAFAFLDRAWAIRDSGLAWVKVDPFLDPLRSDRRFQAIVDRLDFPT
jgi:serine/threonine-protein kinase